MPGRLHSDAMHWADDPAEAAKESNFLARLPTPSRAAVSEMHEEFHQSPNQLFQQLDQSGNRTDAWRMLPTPSRAAINETREEFHQSPNQLFQQLDQSGNRTDAWRMQHDISPDDNLMAPAAQPQPSYRELLQARGQQAMQRSMGGRPCDSPILSPTTVASPTASPSRGQILGSMPPVQVPPLPGLSSMPSPQDQSMQWAHVSQQPQLQQQWYNSPGAGPMDLPVGTNPHGGYHQVTPTLPPAAVQGPPLDDACAQSPLLSMMPGCMSPGVGPQLTDIMCGQLTPSTGSGPSPMTPQMPNLPISPGAETWSQEDVMAKLMPGLFGMDKEQLAQQLREAAPCVYDD